MKPSPMRPSDRIDAVVAMYKQGKTLQEIGNHFMVTRERIRQLLTRAGVNKDEGGVAVRSATKKSTSLIRREQHYMNKYGCSFEQYKEILRIGRESGASRERQPMGAYCRQAQSAKNRGIEFKLKFWDWWQVWQQSGKWEHRGVSGYVMARLMDTGPYEIGNIYITTQSKNIKHYQERRQKKSFDDWSDCYFPSKAVA
jgi:hypothetical protein